MDPPGVPPMKEDPNPLSKLTKNASVLYWPGVRRDPAELALVWEALQLAGLNRIFMDVEYDKGLSPELDYSAFKTFIRSINASNWWIGLSLGGSVAHVIAAQDASIAPQRLTLINPVANRETLSRLANFSLKGLWPLAAENFQVVAVSQVDFVVSKQDRRVPNCHAYRLAECYPNARLRFIELNCDHAISDQSSQKELASLLISDSHN